MHSCQNYFIHKKILADDQVSLIIGGLLSRHINDWISANHDQIITISFDVFMVDFHANYLAKDWEEGMVVISSAFVRGSWTWTTTLLGFSHALVGKERSVLAQRQGCLSAPSSQHLSSHAELTRKF